MSKVNMICPNCEKGFDLGHNGVMNHERGREECDQCAGVKRDAVFNYAWDSGEMERGYLEFANGDKLIIDGWPHVRMLERVAKQ